MSFTTAAYPPLSSLSYISTISAGATFNPASITGCQLWLDGSDSTTLTLTGSNITTWRDKSGSANHMNTLPPSTGTGLWPTVGASINGRSTVKFLSQTGISQSTTLNGVKNFFWVGRIAAPDSGIGGQLYFLLGHDSSYDWCGDSYGSTFLNTSYAQPGIYNASPTSLFTPDARAITNATFSSVYLPTAPNVSLLSVAGITGSTAYQGLCYDRNAHNGWCGDLAEVIIYSTALTVSQREQVEGYLAWKWGLQTYLPNTHPYYSTNPNAGSTSTLTSTVSFNFAGYNKLTSTILTSISNSFSPSSITGCQLWLDGSDSTTLTLTGSNITTWRDKSGSANHMNNLPSSATNPVVGTSINGKSTVSFTGNAAINQSTLLDGVKNLFWVGRIASGGSFYFLLGADSHYDWHGVGYTGTYLDVAYSQPGIYNASPTAQFTADARATTNAVFSSVYTPTSPNVSLLSVSGITGSARYQGICYDRSYAGSRGWRGDLAEVIIYSTALTAIQIQQVEGYLAWKWGLQTYLPGAHNYYLTSPNSGFTSTVTTLYVPKPQVTLTVTPYYTAFTPVSLSTLALWIDGADPLGTGIAPAQGTLISSLKDKSGNNRAISTFSTTVGFPTYKTAANGALGAIQLAAGNGIFLSSISLTPSMSLYAVYSPFNPGSGIAIEQGTNALTNPGFLLTSVSTTSTIYTIGGGATISATGGTVTTAGGFKYHLFTASGTFTLSSTATINYLIVGGGGGGGDRCGGGGGGGGLLSSTWAGTPGTYTITVGLGGLRGATSEGGQTQYGTPAGAGSKGGNSSISSVATAYGGGGGGTYEGNPTDTLIGSGGGGGGTNQPGIAGTAGQGFAGGAGQGVLAGGGGGGAGGAGVSATVGTGGIGSSAYSTQLLAVGYGTSFATSWALGTATYVATPSTYLQSPIVGGVAYIAGGGGGAPPASPGPGGAGGSGGGGRGDWDDTYITGGTTNTGGGGGGSRSNNVATIGRDGGSGLVLIWYPLTSTPTVTGGTVTTSGAYKIHTFTTTGANTFTLTSPASITAQVLVVAGGGSGGSAYAAGGGGAGGAVYNATFTITAGTYTVTVGAGGARTAGGVGILGNPGNNSSFSSITGFGGGGGASYNGAMTAGSGGCGGGSTFGGSAGTGSQGFGGGTSANQVDSVGFNCGGGGGGMGSAGVSPVGTRPNGGAGATYTVAGASYLVSGGGGAGSDGLGGLGRDGGGLGGNGNQAGYSATNGSDATGYGGGGGGGGGNNGSLYGGAGGSGIVIIAYLA